MHALKERISLKTNPLPPPAMYNPLYRFLASVPHHMRRLVYSLSGALLLLLLVLRPFRFSSSIF
jgi:hypothetical protein